jgi:hypothetical protein
VLDQFLFNGNNSVWTQTGRNVLSADAVAR